MVEIGRVTVAQKGQEGLCTALGIYYETGDTTTDKLYTGQQQEYEIGLDYYVARW